MFSEKPYYLNFLQNLRQKHLKKTILQNMPDLNPAWSRPQDEMADWFKLYRDSFQLYIDDLQSNTMLMQVRVPTEECTRPFCTIARGLRMCKGLRWKILRMDVLHCLHVFLVPATLRQKDK